MADEPTLDRSFRGHKAAVTCLAFSPTTRQLASGSSDGAFATCTYTLPAHTELCRRAASYDSSIHGVVATH